MKEKELKSKYQSALENYYKNKNSLLFYRENNIKYLGFAGRETPKPRKKMKIILSESIISYHKIKKYLFSIRKDLSSQLTLIKSLKKEEEVVIAKLIVNCFFDNAYSIISNSLIQLIKQLIDEEALSHPCPFVSSFMSIDGFIGKLIAELIKTSEITEYAALAFKDIINNLDTNYVMKIKLAFEEDINKKQQSNINSNGSIMNSSISVSRDFEIIDIREFNNDSKRTKTKVNIKGNNSMTSNYRLSSSFSSSSSFQANNSNRDHGVFNSCIIDNNTQSLKQETHQAHIRNSTLTQTLNINNSILSDFYNKIQSNSITERKIRLKHIKEQNSTLKAFYNYILQIMSNNSKIFTTHSLSILFMKASEKSIEQFNQTLQTIINLVQEILSKLSNTNCIPELIRLIGRFIFTSVKSVNPNAEHYLVLSYVGKFFYEKCISPLMYFPELYGIDLENKILSIHTRAITVLVNKVLSHLFSFELFQTTISPLYTPLNHHFIQWFPTVIDILESIIQNTAMDTFDHTIQMANFESFCISIPEINLLIDKAVYLSQSEKEIKDLFEIKKMLTEEGEEAHFLFLADEFNPSIINQYDVAKPKNKLLEFNDNENYTYIDEVCTAIHQLFLSLPFIITKEQIGVEALFKGINQKLQFCTDYNELSSVASLPLSWYSNYIISHLNKLPDEYRSNNYQGLYDKLYNDTSSMYQLLQCKDNVLTYDLTYELNTVLLKIKNTIKHKKKMKALQVDIFRLNFIEITPISICFMSGIDVIKFEKKLKYNCNMNEIDPNSLILFPQERCFHMQLRSILKISYQEDELGLRNVCHFNSIKGFINKFKQYSLFSENYILNPETNGTTDNGPNKGIDCNKKFSLSDININKQTNDILFNYIEMIKHALTYSTLLPFYDLRNQEKTINDLLEGIQEYIIQKIWDPDNIPVYLNDYNRYFYLTCLRLNWIDPEKHFKIKKEHISSHHIKIAIDFLKRIDKAKTPGSIIKCFDKATDILMKTFVFSVNKTNIGADDLNPIYLYLFILIKPQKMISQFSFCKLFISQRNLFGKNGYILTTLEWVIGCILGINHETVNLSKEEFEVRCNEAKMQFISGNLSNFR